MAGVPIPLLAWMVRLMGVMPVPAVGVPLSKPPLVKLRPVGSEPLVME